MKEFFTNGIHGFTWKPNDVDSAVQALNEAMKNRQVLSFNCRSHALNHSWNSAANQIADIYSRFKASTLSVNENSMASSAVSVVRKFTRSVYYLSKWLFIMILVLLFMAPFMKVVKPTKQTPVSEPPSYQQVSRTTDEKATKEKPKRARKKRRKTERQESVESLGLSSEEPQKCLIDDEDNLSSISSSSTNISTNTATSTSSGSSKSSRRRRNKKPTSKSEPNGSEIISNSNSRMSRRGVKKPSKKPAVQTGFIAFVLRTVTYFTAFLKGFFSPPSVRTRGQPSSLKTAAKSRTSKRRNSDSNTFVHEEANHDNTYSPRPQFLVSSKSEAYISELVQKSARYLSTLGALLLSLLSLTALFLFINTSAFFPPAVAA